MGASVRYSSASRHRRNECEPVSVTKNRVCSGVTLVDCSHGRLDILMQPGMLTSQLLPDVSRARALRQGERPLVGPHDVFEYREKKKLDVNHFLTQNPEPRTQNPEPRTQNPDNR